MIARLRRWLVRLGLLEAAVLASLLVLVGSVWSFAELADAVAEGESRVFDEWALRSLRAATDPAVARGPVWMVDVARDLTALGSIAVLAVVSAIVLGFLALQRKWGAVWLVTACVIGGALLNPVLKAFFDRARPDFVARFAEVSSTSFPSGHSMLSALTYLTLGTLLARTTANRAIKAYCLGTAIGLSVLVGMTRIYLGVHYPTDVLAGWCAGIAWALICDLVARWLQKAGAVEGEAESGAQ